jgi:serine/threonine-protein kinase
LPQFSPGATVGHFEIVEMIGAGAMAEVYKALDKDAWDHLVALKILSRDARNGPDAEDMRGLFLQEAAALSRVRSAYVVSIISHGLGKTDGGEEVPYIAMEYLEGRDLAAEIRQRKKSGASGVMSVHEAVDIIVAICEGVHTCHKYMVVHRDIKPANIFLVDTPTGVKPTLLDLSVAKLVQSDDPNRSITQMLVGTPSYMAPEQQAARPATSLSDQYSVTAVLFYCLTGVKPKGRDVAAFLATRHGHLPQGLRDVLAKGLSIDPRERFPSVFELGAALHPFASPVAQHLWFPHYTKNKTPSTPVSHTSPTVVAKPGALVEPPPYESVSGPPSTFSQRTTVDPAPPSMMVTGASSVVTTAVALGGASGSPRRSSSPRTPVAGARRRTGVAVVGLGTLAIAVGAIGALRVAPVRTATRFKTSQDAVLSTPTAATAPPRREPTVVLAVPVPPTVSPPEPAPAPPTTAPVSAPPVPEKGQAPIPSSTTDRSPRTFARRDRHAKASTTAPPERPSETRELERAPDGSPILPLDLFEEVSPK